MLTYPSKMVTNCSLPSEGLNVNEAVSALCIVELRFYSLQVDRYHHQKQRCFQSERDPASGNACYTETSLPTAED